MKITVSFDLELSPESQVPIMQQVYEQYQNMGNSIREAICEKMGWQSAAPFNQRIKGEKKLSPIEERVFMHAFRVNEAIITQHQNAVAV